MFGIARSVSAGDVSHWLFLRIDCSRLSQYGISGSSFVLSSLAFLLATKQRIASRLHFGKVTGNTPGSLQEYKRCCTKQLSCMEAAASAQAACCS